MIFDTEVLAEMINCWKKQELNKEIKEINAELSDSNLKSEMSEDEWQSFVLEHQNRLAHLEQALKLKQIK